MKQAPSQAWFFRLLLFLLASVHGPDILAKEYPLFKPNDPQNAVLQYRPLSDASKKGTSAVKTALIEDAREKYPFVRLGFEVRPGAGKSDSFAGILFFMNEVRVPDEGGKILLRLRVSEKELPVTLVLRDVDGRESRAELSKFGGTDAEWKYYRIPVESMDGNHGFGPFIETLTLLCSRPGKGQIDVALIAIDAP